VAELVDAQDWGSCGR